MSNRLHLATRTGTTACITEARRPALTTSLNDVDCKHCARNLAAEHLEESSAAAERRRLQRNREAAYQVGLGDVWDYVAAREDTATDRFLRDIVGTVATWLLEDGYRATDPVEAS